MRLSWGLTPILFCHLAYAAGVVSIYPSPMSTTPGATTQYVIYNTTSGTGVTWSVNGVVGGSATVGTITTGGAYTAPASVPSGIVPIATTGHCTLRSSGAGAWRSSHQTPSFKMSGPEPMPATAPGTGGSIA